MSDPEVDVRAGPGAGQNAGGCGGVEATVGAVRRTLAPAASWAVAALLSALVTVYFMLYEGGPANMLFGLGVTFTLLAVVALLSRRVLFSAVVAAAIVTLIVTAASFKRQTMEMVAHAYDPFFYLSSWSTVTYLWSDHRPYVLAGLACLSFCLFVGWLAWRVDGTRLARRRVAIAAALFAVVAGGAGSMKGERRHTQFFWPDLFVTSFYSSWSETIEALWRGQLIEALEHRPGMKPLLVPAICEPSGKPPHIILIHQESVVQPSLFPQISYDRSIDPLFRSFDGKLHKMRVETYGGASWLTEFSILAGVSTHSFGSMRPFVQSLMAGKIRDTLPESLARCGYRNVVFYPMLRNFVSNARFYNAIGMPEVFDLKDQGAKTANERDRFYFANALGEIEKHIARSDKPLFTYVQTMQAHSPYTYVYAPEEAVPGGGPGTPAELHEYLRRLSLSARDYAWLRAELARRFPGERFLIVHYGDHHPIATRPLLGVSETDAPEDMTLDAESIGFTTYYAVDGQNYRPPPLPAHDILDVPYLGLVVLQAAGLPLSDSFKERRRLMAICEGRYFTCPRQAEVLGFHRQLIDSGLMVAR